MRFAIVASDKDTAGKNIFRHIHEDFPPLNQYLIKEESIFADNIDKNLLKDYDFIIFISKHQGAKSKILSIHAPGNFSNADFGGIPGKVCPTSAFILKIFFINLNKNTPAGWNATLEVTHHGPYINKPCLFIEIGSNEQDWIDKQAGKAIANTIKQSIEQINKEKLIQEKFWSPAIGMGGPHYCPNFNLIQLNSNYALSHIISNYNFPLTKQMLIEAISKTREKVETAIIDWKSLNSEQRKQVTTLLNSLNLKILRTSQIEK